MLEGTVKAARIIAIILLVSAAVLSIPVAGHCAGGVKKPVKYYRINIKSGYLGVRDTASAKGRIIAAFHAGNDCAIGLGKNKKAGGHDWTKVYHPYLRATGWVDAKYMTISKSDCAFEQFIYDHRGSGDWLFDFIADPVAFSSPNVDETATEYTKAKVLESPKNPYDPPYYYLQLFNDEWVKKLWDERDGCARYELMDNKNYDVNLYQLYQVKKKKGAVSVTFICNEMYPEFKFKQSNNGFILYEVEDSGS
jgi:hypothetical protein